MNEYELKNKINEIKYYINSDYSDAEFRKKMYKELAVLESMLKNLQEH